MVKESKKTSKKSTTTKKENTKVKAKKVTENKKKTVKKAEKKKPKIGLFKKIGNWSKAVFKEVSKVKWPSKKEMVKYTISTLAFVILFALFFFGIESLFAFVKGLIG